jgi:hypothetical protein
MDIGSTQYSLFFAGATMGLAAAGIFFALAKIYFFFNGIFLSWWDKTI